MTNTKVIGHTSVGRTCAGGQYAYIDRALDLKTICSETGTDLTESVIRRVQMNIHMQATSFFLIKVLVVRGTYNAGASLADGLSIQAAIDTMNTSKSAFSVLRTVRARMNASGVYEVNLILDVSSLAQKANAERQRDIKLATTTLGKSIGLYSVNYTAAATIDGRLLTDIEYETVSTKEPKL